MKRYLLRRLTRRLVGEPREPIRQVLDHREPMPLAEVEPKDIDHLCGAAAAVFGIVAVATLIIIYTGVLK